MRVARQKRNVIKGKIAVCVRECEIRNKEQGSKDKKESPYAMRHSGKAFYK